MATEQEIPQGDGILARYIGRNLGAVTYRPHRSKHTYVVANGDLVRMDPADFALLQHVFERVEEPTPAAQDSDDSEEPEAKEPEAPAVIEGEKTATKRSRKAAPETE